MKTLLRSTFKADPADDAGLFLRNVQALKETGLGFDHPEDEVVWNWVQDFVSEYLHVPDVSTLRGHFEAVGQLTVVDRLDALSIERPKSQGDFLKLLETKMEARRLRMTSEILRRAGEIATTGITIQVGKKEEHLRGPTKALQYVVEQAVEVVSPGVGQKLSGNVTSDVEDFKQEYELVESDPLAGLGQFVGIQQMDQVLRGSKRGELWTHAAFTGGMKSTFAINWHYNQAIWYGHSSILFSLEMPYPHVRRMMVAIHTAHPKFTDARAEFGVGRGLDYDKVKNGELAEHEKKFLFEVVLRDLKDESNGYGNLHIRVADPDKSDFTVTDMRAKAELLFSKDPTIRMLTIDHAGLMSSRNRYNNTTEKLNEVLRDAKRLSMSFNRGRGIAVNTLFQISREGYKAAEKNGGKYNLTHLSYANEAERSSDIVTASWIDTELEESNLVKFQCLKSRDTAKFADFYAGVLWKCRRVYTTHDVTPDQARKTGDEIDLDLDG